MMTNRFHGLNRESAPHLLECSLNLSRRALDGNIARILAWWWRVEIGRQCYFYGIPLFRRLPGSVMVIGDRCEFRSRPWSNLVGVNRPCMISTLQSGARVQIGSNCGFSGTVIGCASAITIGNGVMCGANVTITDTDWHALDWRDRLNGRSGEAAPVVIGDAVWLGMNVSVLKGVQIGSRTVVGANSLVTRSLPADVIAAGQPAAVVRQLPSRHLHPLLEGVVPGGAISGSY